MWWIILGIMLAATGSAILFFPYAKKDVKKGFGCLSCSDFCWFSMFLASVYLIYLPIKLSWKYGLKPAGKRLAQWQQERSKILDKKAEIKFTKHAKTMTERNAKLKQENKQLKKRITELNKYDRTDIVEI